MRIMKTSNAKAAAQQLAGTVRMARLRLATAETRWQKAKQEARAAKCRRKEIKAIAHRARKQAKQAKADLAEARKALAAAEAKLAQSDSRATTRKPSKAKIRAKPVAGREVAAARKNTLPARQRPAVSSAPSPTPEPAAEATPSLPDIQTRNES